MPRLLIAGFCTAFYIVVTAGAARGQSRLFRGGVELTLPVNDNWESVTTATWRESVTDYYWSRQTINLNATYILGAFKFLANAACFYTEEEEHTTLELRPWQAVSLTFPEWDWAEFNHFVRFEERFQSEYSEWSFSPRLRYQLSTRIAVTNSKLEENTLYLYGAIEYLNNFNRPLEERFSNERTIAGGLGYRFSEKSAIEVMYEADVTENTREEEITEVDVHHLRIRWLKTF